MIYFDDFSFDLKNQELYRNEHKLALQPKQARVLAMLLENAGQVITREQIQQGVWKDEVVEFDQSINFCIRKIRALLNDTAKDSRYIQTLPKRGYKFNARAITEKQATPSEPVAEQQASAPQQTLADDKPVQSHAAPQFVTTDYVAYNGLTINTAASPVNKTTTLSKLKLLAKAASLALIVVSLSLVTSYQVFALLR